MRILSKKYFLAGLLVVSTLAPVKVGAIKDIKVGAIKNILATCATTLLPNLDYSCAWNNRYESLKGSYSPIKFVQRCFLKPMVMGEKTKNFWVIRHADSPLDPGSDLWIRKAVRGGDVNTAQYLVEKKGANIESKNFQGYSKKTALHVAVIAKQFDMVKYLIETGKIDINATDDWGWTALHYAVSDGPLEIVKCLIEHKAKVDIQNNNGHAVIHDAAWRGQLEMVKYLIEEGGVKINDLSKWRQTPLYRAIENRSVKVAEYLMDKGAQIDAGVDYCGHHNRTALRVAAANGDFDIVKLLVESYQINDINAMDSDGKTALYVAIDNGHKGVADYLVAQGAQSDEPTKYLRERKRGIFSVGDRIPRKDRSLPVFTPNTDLVAEYGIKIKE